nr:PAS domain S-box protein [Cyclobacteriaceae bacterium]
MLRELAGKTLRQNTTSTRVENPLELFRLQEALEASNLGIWEWNLATGELQWSENLAGMIGLFGPFDGRGSTYLSHIHEDDREETEARITYAIRNKEDFITVHRVRLPDQSIRWIEGIGKVIYNPEGKAVCLTGTVKDITERKQAEEKLQQREFLFTSLSHIISELIGHVTWEDSILSIMERLGKMMQVDRVYIFENEILPADSVTYTNQRFEWSAGDVAPQIDNPELQHLPVHIFPGIENLLQNKPFAAIISQLDDPDLKALLERQQIFSILIFPVYVRKKFWGFIGFDDCHRERIWTDLEFSVLHTFAASLTSAIERRISTQELVQSERSYRDLFNTVDEAIYVHDLNGVILDINCKVVKLYGYSREELIGQTPAIFMAEGLNDQRMLQEKFMAVLGGTPQTFEWWGKKKDGTFFLKEVHTSKGVYFGKEVIIATAWDITERKQIEEAIRESEQRFRTLQEASFGGIGLHDNGIIIDCNKGLCHITGYSYEELIGMNGFKLIAPEYHQQVKHYVTCGYDQAYDVEGIRKDGSRYFLEIHGRNIPYKGREIRVTEFRDI